MSSGHHRIKWHRNIAENFNRLSRVHERYRQTTDRQTDDRQTTDDRRTDDDIIANMNMSSRSLKMDNNTRYRPIYWFGRHVFHLFLVFRSTEWNHFLLFVFSIPLPISDCI